MKIWVAAIIVIIVITIITSVFITTIRNQSPAKKTVNYGAYIYDIEQDELKSLLNIQYFNEVNPTNSQCQEACTIHCDSKNYEYYNSRREYDYQCFCQCSTYTYN